MTYDVHIDNTIRRGLSYVELISLPISAETLVRRENSDWIQAKDCIELSHVIINTPSYHYDTTVDDNSFDDDASSVDYDDDAAEGDYYDTDSEEQNFVPYHNDYDEPSDYASDDETEERISIPTAEYFKCKQKRKAAIIGVLTLGLAGIVLIGIGNTWRSNIFEGLSFTKHEGMAFVFKCLSFLLLTALAAVPYFIYSVFALIYYSVRLNSLKR